MVLATGIPFLDRGLYFANVTSQRSYALAFRGATRVPRGMYISADAPTRSLRTAMPRLGLRLPEDGSVPSCTR